VSELASVSLDIARRWYAEVLRCTAQVLHNEALVQAFAKVPRERFLDPGPWRVIPPGRAAYTTPDADPRWLYHNVLVVIDEGRNINNGEPRLWAYLFDYLYVRPGERVLQVGAGTYYYIAILREMTGQTGSVIALEYDDPSPDQREIAAGSLAAPRGTTEESSRLVPQTWLLAVEKAAELPLEGRLGCELVRQDERPRPVAQRPRSAAASA
jgi:hypothetical protein